VAEYPPELVDTIAEALDAIPADLRPSTLVNRDRARAALDAITAGRRAIVELPEAADEWRVPDVGNVAVYDGAGQRISGVRITNIGFDLTVAPSEACALSAALLAAVAERGETDQ